LRETLDKSGESQISLSDPGTRLLVKGGEAMVGYNIQVGTDSLNKIHCDYEVTNEVDSGAMVGILERTIENLELEKDEAGKLVEELKGTLDAGYYNGEQLEKAQRLGVTTYVAERESSSASRVPNEAFGLQNFKYDEKKDVYICPSNQELTTNGTWSKVNDNGHLAKAYSTSACKDCPFRAQCTKSKTAGRIIRRSQYAESYKQNKENLKADPSIYKQRQAIVEHPFGTIKRSWGFTYIITKKGKDRATADVGLMFLAYNLLRIFNILDFETLQSYLLATKKVFLGCFLIREQLKAL
jgi:Transposase DDE domain